VKLIGWTLKESKVSKRSEDAFIRERSERRFFSLDWLATWRG
jgi:hypothetical protein